MADHKPKRKFLDLDLDEVSLVDEGANETPVAVMKRREQDEMANANDTKNKPAANGDDSQTQVTKNAGDTTPTPQPNTPEPVGNQPTPEPVPEPVPEAATGVVKVEASEDVLKRLSESVERLVEKTADKPDPATVLKGQLEAAGVSEERIAKTLEAAFPPAPDTSETQIGDTLSAIAEAIQKSKKFTPKRVAELTSAAASLNALLEDINGTADVEKAADKDSNGVGPTEKTVEKSKDGQPGNLNEIIDSAVTKALKPVVEELEVLKGTRTPPTSVANEGGTAGKQPPNGQPVEKNFWAGVLS